MKKPAVWIVLMFGVVFILVIFTAMRGSNDIRVEVCMEFHGQSVCRVASAATEKEATDAAKQNACGILASGVTDSIGCQNTMPKSVTKK